MQIVKTDWLGFQVDTSLRWAQCKIIDIVTMPVIAFDYGPSHPWYLKFSAILIDTYQLFYLSIFTT